MKEFVKVFAAVAVGVQMAFSVNAEASVEKFDIDVENIYRRGKENPEKKQEALKLWEEKLGYLTEYDPAIEGLDGVAYHIAYAYYEKFQEFTDGDKDGILKKISWYLWKVNQFGNTENRKKANQIITNLGQDNPGFYLQTVRGLVKEEVEARKKRIEDLEMTIASLKREMENLLRKSDWAQKRIADLECELQKATEEIMALRGEIKAMIERFNAEKKRMEEQFESEMQKLTDEFEADKQKLKERFLSEKKELIEGYESKLKVERKRADDAEANAARKYQDEYKRLKERADAAELGEWNAKTNLNSVQQYLGQIKQTNSVLEKKVAELTKTVELHQMKSEYYMPAPSGFWRGMGTVVFSPVNYCRCVPQAYQANEEGFVLLTPFLAVWDTTYVVSDLVVGLLDMVSFGAFGNEYYRDGATPWCWERENDLSRTEDTFYKKR